MEETLVAFEVWYEAFPVSFADYCRLSFLVLLFCDHLFFHLQREIFPLVMILHYTSSFALDLTKAY